jgi:hypothetical protein
MILILNLDLDKNDLYKLVNEMDDKSMNKISIKKFQQVYDGVVADSPNTGSGSGAAGI